MAHFVTVEMMIARERGLRCFLDLMATRCVNFDVGCILEAQQSSEQGTGVGVGQKLILLSRATFKFFNFCS